MWPLQKKLNMVLFSRKSFLKKGNRLRHWQAGGDPQKVLRWQGYFINEAWDPYDILGGGFKAI